MTPRQRFPSPASLALAATGVTQRQVAEALGVQPASVSYYLAGKVGTHPRLRSAIAALADEPEAERVMALIPATGRQTIAA